MPKGNGSGQPVKCGDPTKIDSHWRGIVERKLAASERDVLVEALAGALRPFSMFNDVVDLDLRLISGELCENDMRRVLGVYVHVLDRIEEAFDFIFHQTANEPAMDIYRRPLEKLRQLLLDLQDGSKNVWTNLNSKRRGDRSDPRIIRELKNQAARTYKLMLSVDAPADEAIGVINKVAKSYKLSFGLHRLGELTQESIRRRSARVDPFSSTMAEEILRQNLPEPGLRNIRILDLNMRRAVLTGIATHTLSGILDHVWSQSGKKIKY